MLRNFVFETLGCFGSGAFPVGVDPYFESPWRVKAIPVNKKGVYSAKREGDLAGAPTRGR